MREEVGFEPRIFLDPTRVSPAGMGQRDGVWAKLPPIHHGLGDVFGLNVPCLGIAADEQREFDLWHQFERLVAPCGCANFWWREVSALGVVARETEGHWEDREFGLVVKCGLINAHPIAQTIPRWIGEGATRFVDAGPRCLADYHDFCRLRKPCNRARAVRGVRLRELFCA